MSLRFRRSIKLLPGIRLNVGKTGVSTSIGVRGAHVTVGKQGTRTTVGLSGTGLSYISTSKHESGATNFKDVLVGVAAVAAVLGLIVLAAAMAAH